MTMIRMLLAILALSVMALQSADAQPTPCPTTAACAKPQKYLSAATTNATSVTSTNTALFNIITFNTTTTVYYLKLYDKASAPTCNSDTVVATYPVPFGASNAVGGFMMARTVPAEFLLGLAFCLTGGLADNDNTSAATGVAINFEYRAGP
jgi:hypothetical protein